MPLYEYECTQCGDIQEIIQKCSAKPLSKCKNCSGKLQKLISQSTFHLKGTGWYVTDYADKSKKSCNTQKKRDEKSKTVSKKAETVSKATDKTV